MLIKDEALTSIKKFEDGFNYRFKKMKEKDIILKQNMNFIWKELKDGLWINQKKQEIVFIDEDINPNNEMMNNEEIKENELEKEEEQKEEDRINNSPIYVLMNYEGPMRMRKRLEPCYSKTQFQYKRGIIQREMETETKTETETEINEQKENEKLKISIETEKDTENKQQLSPTAAYSKNILTVNHSNHVGNATPGKLIDDMVNRIEQLKSPTKKSIFQDDMFDLEESEEEDDEEDSNEESNDDEESIGENEENKSKRKTRRQSRNIERELFPENEEEEEEDEE